MNNSRNNILSRVREAKLSGVLPGALDEHPAADLHMITGGLDEFVTEVEQLSGQVMVTDDPVGTVVGLCRERAWASALCWAWDQIGCEGLETAVAEAGLTTWQHGPSLELADLPVGITGAEAGLAATGTLVMRNGPGCNPLASLLPPVHVALLDREKIYPDMPVYFKQLADTAAHIRETSNLIFISGPSRTADIEQTLTLGVHGPREVIVIVY